MSADRLEDALRVAGALLLGICAASLGVPRALRWREDIARLRPLNRQIFVTYSGYILATNLAQALLALLRPEWLVAGGGLAGGVSAYCALYWGARLAIQLFGYDRASAPQGALYEAAHWGFTAAFAAIALVFGAGAHAAWSGTGGGAGG